MPSLLHLPGSKAKDGYHSLDTPVKEHTVSGGGIREQVIELGDLANDPYYDEVASIRESIRVFDSSSLESLRLKQLRNLQSPSDDLSVELQELSAALSLDAAKLRSRVEALGGQVGRDEARRSHWENLKAQLGRAVEKWRRVEMEVREKVRERVGRQLQIVNPSVTDDEIKAALDTSTPGSMPPIFQQAVAGGARTVAALSALNEAKTRHGELLAIESTLVELAGLMQQVADLVVVQDSQFIHIEDTSKSVEGDMEAGVAAVSKAKLSAAAARHKRKLCFAFAAVIVLVIVVVVVVQLKGNGGGGGGDEKEKTETKTVSGTTDQTATSAAVAATSAPARWA
ncbi:hypothetical protein JCM8097_007466 [Rhodosporidiobolus ruineniae]